MAFVLCVPLSMPRKYINGVVGELRRVFGEKAAASKRKVRPQTSPRAFPGTFLSKTPPAKTFHGQRYPPQT